MLTHSTFTDRRALISVIIPSYNNERYIVSAIKSVLDQSYKNIEIIIVNDGSTDNTEKICQEFCAHFNQIKYYYQNVGSVSKARNSGLRYADGEYILFLDSDDLLLPNTIEILYKKILKYNVAAVFGNHAYLYGKKIIPRLPRLSCGKYTYKNLKDKLLDDGTLSGMLLGSVCGVLYDNKVLKATALCFEPDMQINEDGFFNFKFMRAIDKMNLMVYTFNEPCVYLYRQWKSRKNLKLEIDKRYDYSTEIIKNYLATNCEEEFFQAQFAYREVSVAFWNALRVKDCKCNIFLSRRYLNTLFKRQNVKNGIKSLNYAKMNVYKRFLCILMKYRLSIVFYYFVHYIYPFAEKILKR